MSRLRESCLTRAFLSSVQDLTISDYSVERQRWSLMLEVVIVDQPSTPLKMLGANRLDYMTIKRQP